MAFIKATRRRAFLKLALSGPSGSGKTMSALRLARGLTDGQIALIDTENKSSSLYAGQKMTDDRTGEVYQLAFDVDDLPPPYASDQFINSIKAAKAAGYEVLVIDSFSHVWEAVLKFKAVMDEAGGNSYTNWNAAGKKFSEVLDLVRSIDMHIICCMRSKMEYVLETNEKGKQAPRKVGLAPICRDGTEYEFSTMFEIDMQNQAKDSKGRLKHITGGEALLLTESVGQKLRDWINEGEAPLPAPEAWTADKKAEANAAVAAYMAAGGKQEDITAIKAKGLSPTETIDSIKSMTSIIKETT
jgi:DNA polymerase III delta prime subunit